MIIFVSSIEMIEILNGCSARERATSIPVDDYDHILFSVFIVNLIRLCGFDQCFTSFCMLRMVIDLFYTHTRLLNSQLNEHTFINLNTNINICLF